MTEALERLADWVVIALAIALMALLILFGYGVLLGALAAGAYFAFKLLVGLAAL